MSFWLITVLCLCQNVLVGRAQLQPNVTYIYTGQQLADEVANYGIYGQNTVLELASPNITMHGVVFHPWNTTNSSTAFSSGLLTVRGNPLLGYTVLDTAMRANLTPILTGSARLKLQDLSMINMCEQSMTLNRAGLVSISALDQGMWRRTSTRQTHEYVNLKLYARQADIVRRVYLRAMQKTTFPRIQAMVRSLVVDLPTNPTVLRDIGPYFVESAINIVPAAKTTNNTAQSIADPHDPLLISMRAAGTLMAPQYCNGTRLPESVIQAEVSVTTHPMWLAGDSPRLWHALTMATNISGDQVQLQRPPVAVTLTDSTLLDQQSSGLDVDGPVILYGPPSADLLVLRIVTLDLGQQAGLLRLQPGGQLFIQDLRLDGLAARALPALTSVISNSNETDSQQTSAFPLAFVELPTDQELWITDAPIYMYNVSLVLPTSDYEALLVLSNIAQSQLCLSPNSVRLAEQLQLGFTSLAVDSVSPDWAELVMGSMVGWGVNGIAVRLYPPAGWSPPVCSSGLSHKQKVIIITCTVVLGTAVLLAVGFLLVKAWRKHQQRKGTDDGMPNKTFSTLFEPKLDDQDDSYHANQPNSKTDEDIGRSDLQLPMLPDLRQPPPLLSRPPVPLRNLVLMSEDRLQLHTNPNSSELDHNSNVVASGDRPMSSIASSSRQDGTAVPRGNVHLELFPMSEMQTHRSVLQESDVGIPAEAGKDDSGDAVVSHVVLSFMQPPAVTKTASLATSDTYKAIRSMTTALSKDGGKVNLKGILGQGAWGTVYLGEWRGLGVALKTMVFPAEQLQQYEQQQPQQATTPEIVTGDLQPIQQQQQQPRPVATAPAIMEAAIAASVGHRNVVATYMYDIKPCGTAADVPGPGGLMIDESQMAQTGRSTKPAVQEYKLYLLQELCGCTLSDAIQNRSLCDPAAGYVDKMAVFTLLLDIALGLDYLHSRSIIHGDLKPANVLLKLDPSARCGVVAKLTDFGLSVRINPGATHVSNFKSGTPFYVAPEVITQQWLSYAADIFAYGIMMWQLFTSQTPWVDVPGQPDAKKWNPSFPQFLEPNIPPPAYQIIAYNQLGLLPFPKTAQVAYRRKIKQEEENSTCV